MPSFDPGRTPFICPNCRTSLVFGDGELRCPECAETVPIIDGIPQFFHPTDENTTSTLFDHLSSIYETPLWFPLLYRALVWPRLPPDDRGLVATYLTDGVLQERNAPPDETVAGEYDVLDVACGTGRFTRYIADGARFVWGADIAPGMLQKAQQYARRDGVTNVTFALMDAGDLRFESAVFDGVACCWALHLFPDLDDVLAEIHRTLAPGGRFAGTTLVDASLLAVEPVQFAARHTLGARVFEAEQFRARLQAAGFQEVTFERRGGGLFFGAVA